MRSKQLAVLTSLVIAILSTQAWAVDLNIDIQTLNPTSIVTVSYKIAGVTKTVAGADATAPVTVFVPDELPGTKTLTSTLGVFQFELDAAGNVSVPGGGSLSATGNILTILNTISLPELTVSALNPTSVNQVSFWVHAMQGPERRLVGEREFVSGGDVQVGATIPFEGMVGNQQFALHNTFGLVYFWLDDAGEISITHDPDLHGVAPAAAIGSAITIQNNISFPTLSVRAEDSTSASEVSFGLAARYANERQAVGTTLVMAGTEAPVGATFPFEGMAQNQGFTLYSTFGFVYFQLDEIGGIVITHDPDLHGVAPTIASGTTITIQNIISFPLLEINAAKNTSLSEVRFVLMTAAGNERRYVGDWQVVPGDEIQSGVTIPFEGMAQNQDFEVRGSFGYFFFSLDEAGNLLVSSHPYFLPATAFGTTLTMQNTLDRRLEVTAEYPSAVDTVTYRLRTSEMGVYILVDDDKTLPGAEIDEGVQFLMTGMAATQDFRLDTPFGNVPFHFNSEGNTIFYAPAEQLTSTSASVPIEGDTNTLYLNILPSNTPPEVDAGENFVILSEEQPATIIHGYASDPEGDTLYCRWLKGEEVVVDSTEILGTECPLDLGLLAPLDRAGHSFTLEVTDEIASVTDDVVVTVENTAPEGVASGGGAYEYGALIELAGEVADYDGDELTYAWWWRELELASGILTAVAGGDPVELDLVAIDSVDLGLGEHILELMVSDGVAEATAQILVAVQDTTAPTLAPVASPAILWPPNHSMVMVTVEANAQDDSGGSVELSAEVESSEPADFDGDGNFISDYEVLDVNSATGIILVNLRSERSGKGGGRTYTITVTAADDAGNESNATVEVLAPHSKGRNR